MRPSNRASRPVLPARYWRLKPLTLMVVDVMDWLFPFCIINLLWVLLSLTVVLFPPATASLFEVGYRAYRGTAPAPGAFLRGVRRWLVPAWLWAGANALLVAGTLLAARALAGNELLAAAVAALAGLLLLAQLYLWPYMMLQEAPSLPRAFRNSLFTILGDPLLTGTNLVLTVIILVPGLVVVAPALLIVPVLLTLLYTYSLTVWLAHHRILPGAARDV